MKLSKLKFLKSRLGLAVAASTMTLVPVAAFASGGLGDYIQNGESFAYILGKGAMVLMFLVGIVAAGMLIFQFFNMHQTQGEPGRGKKMVFLTLACALGLGFGGFIDHVLHTVEGSSATTTQSVSKSNFGLQ